MEAIQIGSRGEFPDDIASRLEDCRLLLTEAAKPGKLARSLGTAMSIIKASPPQSISEPSPSVAACLEALEAIALPTLSPAGIPTQSLHAVLENLEMAIAALTDIKQRLLQALRQSIQPAADSADPAQQAVAAADLSILQQAVQGLKTAETEGNRQLEHLCIIVQAAGAAQAPESFSSRREDLHGKLAGMSGMGKARQTITKIESTLASAGVDAAQAQACPALTNLQTELTAILEQLGAQQPTQQATPDNPNAPASLNSLLKNSSLDAPSVRF